MSPVLFFMVPFEISTIKAKLQVLPSMNPVLVNPKLYTISNFINQVDATTNS